MKPSAHGKASSPKSTSSLQRTPSDGEPSPRKPKLILGYDDKNLYAIFICFDNEPHKVRARLSRREDVFR